jgi:hypothetical protein
MNLASELAASLKGVWPIERPHPFTLALTKAAIYFPQRSGE